MKKLFFAIPIALLPYVTAAQSKDIINEESRLLGELKKEHYEIDSSAKAVILAKSTIADFDGYRYIVTVEMTAKILSDEAASDLSLINIAKTRYASVYSISGETYNLENGKIAKQLLNKDEIKKDNITEGIDIFKFNLPAVKKGSIIHYKYKITHPNTADIPDYYLQGKYPVLYQTYEVAKPSVFEYINIERVNVPIVRAKSKSQLENVEAGYYAEIHSGQDSYELWVRRNEPAFNEEPMMGASVNYKERIRVQIKKLLVKSYLDNWDYYNRTYVYNNDEWVGQVFKSNGFLRNKTSELTAGATTDIDKAKAIYAFVRDNFNVKYTSKDFSLRTIYNDRYGSENEINLLLTAMLRSAELSANPVFLSPKPGEKLNPVYPDNQNTKVIITSLKIDKTDVYLDATQKHLPFGVILPEYYNGYARWIDKDSKGIELDPTSFLEKSVTMASIKPGSNPNELILKYDSKPGAFEAFNYRKRMANDTALIRKEIMKSLNKGSMSYTLSAFNVDNLNNPEVPLKLHFEAALSLDKEETIYLNPFLEAFFERNPLSAAQRQYPIEMDYRDDKSYVFTMQLPTEYVVDDYPKSAIYKMDDAGTMVYRDIYSYDESTNTLVIKSNLQNTECTFPATAYEGLRTFYGKIVECQNQKIVIKKKS